MSHIAYLSLGSNIGNREQQLHEAIARLESRGRVISVSSFYETEPVEFPDQAWFLNCAIALQTNGTPQQLMAAILDIEQEMGRKRLQKKGPRNIDIDILLFDDTVLNTPQLEIPHPAMANRRFVLAPLAEIAGEVIHPLLHKSIEELLEELPAGQEVKKARKNADENRGRWPTTND
jgi:2-amino-4-hydroxy-6-hydroxymethyldihydropteridine diphosphokinase